MAHKEWDELDRFFLKSRKKKKHTEMTSGGRRRKLFLLNLRGNCQILRRKLKVSRCRRENIKVGKCFRAWFARKEENLLHKMRERGRECVFLCLCLCVWERERQSSKAVYNQNENPWKCEKRKTTNPNHFMVSAWVSFIKLIYVFFFLTLILYELKKLWKAFFVFFVWNVFPSMQKGREGKEKEDFVGR